MSEHAVMRGLDEVKTYTHWGRTFTVGDVVWSERHQALGKIDKIFLNSLDRDHYAVVDYEDFFEDRSRTLRASDPLNTLRHATEREKAVHEAKKALDL